MQSIKQQSTTHTMSTSSSSSNTPKLPPISPNRHQPASSSPNKYPHNNSQYNSSHSNHNDDRQQQRGIVVSPLKHYKSTSNAVGDSAVNRRHLMGQMRKSWASPERLQHRYYSPPAAAADNTTADSKSYLTLNYGGHQKTRKKRLLSHQNNNSISQRQKKQVSSSNDGGNKSDSNASGTGNATADSPSEEKRPLLKGYTASSLSLQHQQSSGALSIKEEEPPIYGDHHHTASSVVSLETRLEEPNVESTPSVASVESPERFHETTREQQSFTYPIPSNPRHDLLSREFSLLSYTTSISDSMHSIQNFRLNTLSLIDLLKSALDFDEAPCRVKEKERRQRRRRMQLNSTDDGSTQEEEEQHGIDYSTWKSLKNRVQQNTSLDTLKHKKWYLEDMKMNSTVATNAGSSDGSGGITSGDYTRMKSYSTSQKNTTDDSHSSNDSHSNNGILSHPTPTVGSSYYSIPNASNSTMMSARSEYDDEDDDEEFSSLSVEMFRRKMYWLPLEIEYIVRKNTKRLYRNLLRLEGRLPYEKMVQQLGSSNELDIFFILERCEEVTQRIFEKQTMLIRSRIDTEELSSLRRLKRKYTDNKITANERISQRLERVEYIHVVSVVKRKIEIFLETHIFPDPYFHKAVQFLNVRKVTYQEALKWFTNSDPFASVPDYAYASVTSSVEEDASSILPGGAPLSSPSSKRNEVILESPQITPSGDRGTTHSGRLKDSNSVSNLRSPSSVSRPHTVKINSLWKKFQKELSIVSEDSFMMERIKKDMVDIFDALYMPDGIKLMVRPQHFGGDIGKYESFRTLLQLFDTTEPLLLWEELDIEQQ